jgi:hypothetical protein
MNAHQEIWDCLQILNRKAHWLFQPENANEKMTCLQKISQTGNPHIISQLIPLLQAKPGWLANQAADTIITLFKKIPSKNQYANCLKYAPFGLKDLEWINRKFNRDQVLYLQAIASFNHSGYLREKAVINLGTSDRADAIPFLIYRLADWVKPVREKAREQLANFFTCAYLPALTENLSTFEALKKVERVNLADVYQEVVTFLLSEENRDTIITRFAQFTIKSRFALAKELLARPNWEKEVIPLLLSDSSFLIRNLLTTKLDAIDEIIKKALVGKLLKDRVAKVRLHTYYQIVNDDRFKEDVLSLLYDPSPSMREWVRYKLKKEGIDVLECYRQGINEPAKQLGSILGLSEVGGKEDASLVETFLSSSAFPLKLAAFISLSRLDADRAYSYALEGLESDIPKIRKLAISFLATRANEAVLTKAHLIFQLGNREQKNQYYDCITW